MVCPIGLFNDELSTAEVIQRRLSNNRLFRCSVLVRIRRNSVVAYVKERSCYLPGKRIELQTYSAPYLFLPETFVPE
jgi:hypothetical protein